MNLDERGEKWVSETIASLIIMTTDERIPEDVGQIIFAILREAPDEVRGAGALLTLRLLTEKMSEQN